MTCIPPFHACGHHHREHYCADPADHPRHGHHHCECGVVWPIDAELEAAQAAYRAFYDTRYRDEVLRNPDAVVNAACLPADSPWRRVARAGGR